MDGEGVSAGAKVGKNVAVGDGDLETGGGGAEAGGGGLAIKEDFELSGGGKDQDQGFGGGFGEGEIRAPPGFRGFGWTWVIGGGPGGVIEIWQGPASGRFVGELAPRGDGEGGKRGVLELAGQQFQGAGIVGDPFQDLEVMVLGGGGSVGVMVEKAEVAAGEEGHAVVLAEDASGGDQAFMEEAFGGIEMPAVIVVEGGQSVFGAGGEEVILAAAFAHLLDRMEQDLFAGLEMATAG